MATYKSNMVKKATRQRALYSGKETSLGGRIRLPAGTVLAQDDILLFAPIGENQRVNKVRAYISEGSLPTAEGTIGYAQILDDAGQPVVVERLGPFGGAGSKFASPTSAENAYASAAVFSTAREVVQTTAVKLPGPVYLCMEVTTGGTVGGNGVEIFCGAEFDGEISPIETAGDTYAADQSYLLGDEE